MTDPLITRGVHECPESNVENKLLYYDHTSVPSLILVAPNFQHTKMLFIVEKQICYTCWTTGDFGMSPLWAMFMERSQEHVCTKMSCWHLQTGILSQRPCLKGFMKTNFNGGLEQIHVKGQLKFFFIRRVAHIAVECFNILSGNLLGTKVTCWCDIGVLKIQSSMIWTTIKTHILEHLEQLVSLKMAAAFLSA